MESVLTRLNQWNLTHKVETALEFLNQVDPCFLGLIVAVFVVLGARMVAGQSVIRGWGLRMAVLTFFVYGGYRCYVDGISWQSKQALGIGLRAGCVAGAVLAFVWIVVPIASFVLRYLRVALAAFLSYGGYLTILHSSSLRTSWQVILTQAGVAAGLSLLVAWITEPIWKYVGKHWLPRRRPAPDSTAQEEHATPLPSEVVSARPARRRTTMIAPANEHLVDSLEADLESAKQREAQRRREKARLQVELTYVLAMPTIAQWFPRSLLDNFVKRHMHDALTPEDVEENARQLQTVLQQHQEQMSAHSELNSMEELTNWLLGEQQRIEAQTMDPSVKQGQMLDLHQRYVAMASRVVRNQSALAC